MTKVLTRRALLGGGLAALGTAALADAPRASLRPLARPGQQTLGLLERPGKRPVARPSVEDIVREAGLGGTVAFVLADTASGTVIESRFADAALPPASVAKAVTAHFAYEQLGPAYRFKTRLMATGPVVDGVLQGDLILAGGGDPVLGTDDLTTMAAALSEAGVGAVSGRFAVWGGALPEVSEIDPDQQSHFGYNPAISGLNLNFNRVHFGWTRQGQDYVVTMDARTDQHRPEVGMARMRVVDRSLPVYTYAAGEGLDDWTVARAALGTEGARWLPVRNPALYAADVFRSMARSHGINLAPAVKLQDLPEGASEVVSHQSPPLDTLIEGMLRYSTNLTAEVLGLTSTKSLGVQPETLANSAAVMNGWVVARYGARAVLVDHSGLGDRSRISARDMTRILSGAGANDPVRALLKDVVLVDGDGDALVDPALEVEAKTGTLNFVSALAGHLRTETGKEMVFAIFTAEMDAREAAKDDVEEVPDGARAWNGRSRRLQQRLLQRWGVVFGT